MDRITSISGIGATTAVIIFVISQMSSCGVRQNEFYEKKQAAEHEFRLACVDKGGIYLTSPGPNSTVIANCIVAGKTLTPNKPE